jgi:hypothetical protein
MAGKDNYNIAFGPYAGKVLFHYEMMLRPAAEKLAKELAKNKEFEKFK